MCSSCSVIFPDLDLDRLTLAFQVDVFIQNNRPAPRWQDSDNNLYDSCQPVQAKSTWWGRVFRPLPVRIKPAMYDSAEIDVLLSKIIICRGSQTDGGWNLSVALGLDCSNEFHAGQNRWWILVRCLKGPHWWVLLQLVCTAYSASQRNGGLTNGLLKQ